MNDNKSVPELWRGLGLLGLSPLNVNTLIPLATRTWYYDGHAADRPQLPVGKTGGFSSDVSGMRRRTVEMPIPWFFVSSVCRISVRSIAQWRGQTSTLSTFISPASSSATGQWAQRNSQNAALWNAQPRTKTMSAESG